MYTEGKRLFHDLALKKHRAPDVGTINALSFEMKSENVKIFRVVAVVATSNV